MYKKKYINFTITRHVYNTTETSLCANGILFYTLFKLPKLDAALARWSPTLSLRKMMISFVVS